MQRLNAEQREALDTEGDVLLVACPGSGKTHTLIHKLARELNQLTSHREFIIALTYTHVAAEEIRDRIIAMGVDTSQLWVGTIHSFCLNWILRPYSLFHQALKDGFGVVDLYDSEQLLDEIARRHPPLESHYDCKHYATENGYAFDLNIPPNQIQPLQETLNEYHEELRSRQLIDFEMMLKYSHDLLTSHPSIAPRLGRLFKFIAIDEYQDTREIQYSIVGKIVKESQGHTHFFMVGDPNQAIYGSLGGVAKSREEIGSLTGRKVTQLTLQRNYRSSRSITDYFSQFAVNPVPLEAVGQTRDYQSTIIHDTSVSKSDLVRTIAYIVKHDIEVRQVRPENICVIAPWWMHLASITRALVKELPAYDFNGPGLSPFGQNLDNYWFKVARIALTSAAPGMFNRRIRWAQEIIDVLVAHGYISASLTARELLKITNGISPTDAKGTDFLINFFDIFCRELGFELVDRSELNEQRSSFFARMQKRLTDIMTRDGIDVDHAETFKKVFRPHNGVVISTIHGVKGAEFDTVIGFGLLEGFVPHYTEPESQKETVAKKLLYVIGSRAKKHLYLISEMGRGNQRYPKYQSNVLRGVNKSLYTSSCIHLPGLPSNE